MEALIEISCGESEQGKKDGRECEVVGIERWQRGQEMRHDTVRTVGYLAYRARR